MHTSRFTENPIQLPGQCSERFMSILGWQSSVVIGVQDWSPHMSFILKGYQISTLQLKDWFKSKTFIQEYRKRNTNLILTCACIIWYMFAVQYEELSIHHLTPFLVVAMPYACWFLWRTYHIEDFKWQCLHHFQFGVAFWKVVLREVDIFWRAKSRLKGIEDFNLEH